MSDSKKSKLIIGSYYSGIGTSGITDGTEVKGELTKIDEWGAYLTSPNGIQHLCNATTLRNL